MDQKLCQIIIDHFSFEDLYVSIIYSLKNPHFLWTKNSSILIENIRILYEWYIFSSDTCVFCVVKNPKFKNLTRLSL